MLSPVAALEGDASGALVAVTSPCAADFTVCFETVASVEADWRSSFLRSERATSAVVRKRAWASWWARAAAVVESSAQPMLVMMSLRSSTWVSKSRMRCLRDEVRLWSPAAS